MLTKTDVLPYFRNYFRRHVSVLIDIDISHRVQLMSGEVTVKSLAAMDTDMVILVCVIAGSVVIGLLSVTVYCCIAKKKSNSKEEKDDDEAHDMSNSYVHYGSPIYNSR